MELFRLTNIKESGGANIHRLIMAHVILGSAMKTTINTVEFQRVQKINNCWNTTIIENPQLKDSAYITNGYSP